MSHHKKKESLRVEPFRGMGDTVDQIAADLYATNSQKKTLEESRYGFTDEIRTLRHQPSKGFKKAIDEREKHACVAVLRLGVVVLILAIAFFMLWKGIGFYEASRIASELKESRHESETVTLQTVELVEHFDIRNQESRKLFAERIERWAKADRLVRSADALLLHKSYDQAVAQCQAALENDPSHWGSLERLGQLYYVQKDYLDAVNVYIRLMGIDPSRQETQKKLIQALDAYGDNVAVQYMADWYFEQNTYNSEVQHYLARALYRQKKFREALVAYERVLRDQPEDLLILERLVAIHMQLGQYEKALGLLGQLRRNNDQNPNRYKQTVVCNAQLGRTEEAIEALARADQRFGKQIVLELIRDSLLDPIREDRRFQSFMDRIIGEELRRWTEQMAKGAEGANEPEKVNVELGVPEFNRNDSERLKLKR